MSRIDARQHAARVLPARSDVPADPARRDAVLIKIMGSDPPQPYGLGGSKSMISRYWLVGFCRNTRYLMRTPIARSTRRAA